MKGAAAAGRKLRLMNETLKELVAAKARNDEEEEGKVVGELKAQNGGIRALLVRVAVVLAVWLSAVADMYKRLRMRLGADPRRWVRRYT